MSILGTFKSYIQVRPVGIRNAVRLYASYGISPVVKFLAPSHFRSVGYFILGRSNVTVSIGGILANIRPRTSDLDIFALALEPHTASLFKVERGNVFVDIGAHIGRYTLMAARYASKVIAIEPDPSNFLLLRENIALNSFSNIITLQLALSRDQGRYRLYVAGGSDTARSSLEPEWRLDTAGRRKGVEVTGESLDNLIDSLGLQIIDWLKIDVEGHEVSVLEGGRYALAKTKRLILEVARGNEKACKDIVKKAGLEIVSVEKEMGTRVSNWLLVRDRSLSSGTQ